ncbi:hypothetical protein ACQP00_40010 [Dactylosporangium sp. CS-047395]|uniref:hypothetical protein n=1 Tax=Dactylosporangium sp. CS-047395 TaxID=3239936 RepID=UPI003D89F5C5
MPADTIQSPLLDLENVPLKTLLSKSDSEAQTTLDRVVKRLFDPNEREQHTISAFGSAL